MTEETYFRRLEINSYNTDEEEEEDDDDDDDDLIETREDERNIFQEA